MQALHGVLSAREFVWWYNGHPDNSDLQLDLSKMQSVAICGLGNVAVDCARVLLQPVERLASTDIAQHALQQLQHSAVKEVHLIGRRGPVQVSMQRRDSMLCHWDLDSNCLLIAHHGLLVVGITGYREQPEHMLCMG